MQPLPPNSCDNRRLAPTAPFVSQSHPTCVYGYHQLHKDSMVTPQHGFCERGNQVNRPGFPSQRSITGYTKTISERSVSPNDAGYSTEPATRCYYHGYRNHCMLHQGYAGLPNNCRVLQGYYSYPGLQYMGLPSNYGNRAGEEDADESDVSECEGQDGVSKCRSSHQEADFTASEKPDKVQWAQMGVL
ncbi:uncharacterized protein LOC121392552 [Gigantopelta aegis]|uniref:uncharacterized protein LOC121392552 n=1 Tax=Gigantopelta aegis TaxID=1735272 RepID=UPI001B8895B3|nr:uncharacterized protein LOC121392552 [Gigantopelta aegis]